MKKNNEKKPANLSDAIRQRVVEIENEKKITLKEVSENGELAYDTLISFMEGRTNIIKITTLFKICNGLGISLHDFFNSPIFNDKLNEMEFKFQ